MIRFQGVLDDIKTLEDNVNSISDITTDLLRASDKDFAEKLRGEVDSLTRRWADISQLARDQKQRLIEAQKRTQALWDSVKEQEIWMEKVKREHLAREYTVHSDQELNDLVARFKVLEVCETGFYHGHDHPQDHQHHHHHYHHHS